MTVLDEEVAALDKLDAHLVGQEDMLEIGGVVAPRRQHHDGRIAQDIGRHGAEIAQQEVGIVAHRRHALAREGLRKQAQHDLAVLKDI